MAGLGQPLGRESGARVANSPKPSSAGHRTVSGCRPQRLCCALSRLFLPLILLALPAASLAQFNYTTANGQTTITGYTGPGGAVTIPNMINGAPVTSIASFAFSSQMSLTSVVMPNSVTSIGDGAFYHCINLASITISNSITSIPNYAFLHCGNLASVTIPNGVASIRDWAFSGCSSLISVSIPNSVTSLASNAFSYCYSLTSVTIPSSVTSIGDSAFSNCYSLATVTIPSGVTSIGNYAFLYCSSLTGVAIPSSVTSIGTNTLGACSSLVSITVDAQNSAYGSVDGVLCNKAKTLLIQYPGGNTGNYMIPDSVTSIGSYAFYYCANLASVTIPSSVTSIGSYAFQYCTNLTIVTVPASVTSIGSYAFDYCGSLTSAVFMGNAPSMGSSVFESTSQGFAVYYINAASGFTTPTWNGYTAVNMGVFSPATPWLLSYGFPYNADLQSVPNHDGVSLLAAYALNLDPTVNQSASLPRAFFAANQISLTFYAGSAGVLYLVESSIDSRTWSTAGVTILGPDANDFCTATAANNGRCGFLRLKVIY